MNETSRVWMSVVNEAMSYNKEHLLEKRYMLDAEARTKHLLEKWILIDDRAL